ncbi:hypothetical protein GCK72_000841 [Caenorhabditis remanei]|nr:hypothetical protein GCK72_000841 [Caenorhabditis remanei]KAF1769028.1 hypothetical protein GCK72_000841 [Caenorhabditis remanei]
MLLLHWMASEYHQNLMYLTINIKDPQSLDTVFNLPYEIVNSDVERTGRLSNNTTISLQGNIDIKRNDGMTGTIKLEWRLNELLLKMVITRIQ